jgi:PD-(D/E)XK endonuclease
MPETTGANCMEQFQLHQGDCLTSLRAMPDNSVDSIVTDLAAGHAAEHLVCADILLQGYAAFLTDQVCAYDVAADVGGRLIRIQVKATRATRAIPQRASHFPAYMWNVRRAGKNGARLYADDEFDLLALVALDTKQIAYMPPSKIRQTIHIRPDNDNRPATNKSGKYFSQFRFKDALREVANG